jgi:hypothetical protein
MSADEVIDFFAPEQSTTEAVMQWIVESGISADRIALSANKQVIPSPVPMNKFPIFISNPGISGFNLTPLPPKLKIYSLLSSTSGSMHLELTISRLKLITCLLTSKNTLTM